MPVTTSVMTHNTINLMPLVRDTLRFIVTLSSAERYIRCRLLPLGVIVGRGQPVQECSMILTSIPLRFFTPAA